MKEKFEHVLKFILAEQIILVVSFFFELLNVFVINGSLIFNEIIETPWLYASRKNILYIFIFANIIYIMYKMLKLKQIKISSLFKYRYFFAVFVFLICVMFEVHGSSISSWTNFLDNDDVTSKIIFGKNRDIRTDEWAVSTPMGFSQYKNNFAMTTPIVRADNTDIYIIYGQPVKDINIIFRIFQIGYLFLSPAKGLSFFWCGRFIALFMVTLEFGILLTKNKKKLSIALAILITFAPTIGWWFAINGLVEMIIFAELGTIMLYKYIKTEKYKLKALYFLIICLSAGNFLMTFYPAWMIPITYMFIPIILSVIITNFKEIKIGKKDILIFLGIGSIFLLLISRIFINSSETINITRNTSYPGSRFETGGGQIYRYFEGIMSLGLSIFSSVDWNNACEYANIFDFWPVAVILVIYIVFKEKKKDIFLIFMSIVYILLSIYCILGFPKFLSEITLLYNCPASRVASIQGILGLYILIRALSITNIKIGKEFAFILSEAIVFVLLYFSNKSNSDYVVFENSIFIFIIGTLALYFTLRANEKTNKFLITIFIVMIISSGLINPICIGTDAIYKNKLGVKIEEIVKSDKDANWILESIDFPRINYPIIFGAHTINSTNVYPNLDRWKSLDKDNKYLEIYNRYAHIQIILDEKYESAEFELKTPDSFVVKLNEKSLKEVLNVKYILTERDLGNKYNFDEKYNDGKYYIYQVK